MYLGFVYKLVVGWLLFWKVVRVVEGARLESVCMRKYTGGSNPPLSGVKYKNHFPLVDIAVKNGFYDPRHLG